MSKKYFFSIIFIHLILNINSQSSSINKNDISITNKIDPFKKLNYKPIDCDEICSKFKKNCPQLYEEIIDYSTKVIIDEKIIENNFQDIPQEIVNAFFYKGLYEYYGIATDTSSPNLEQGLLYFIIASYFGNREANYRLFILYDSDLINHIIHTDKFKNLLKNHNLLKLIKNTNFWKNFEIFEKYPNTNEKNDQLRYDLQKEIGYNFLYLSILKKYQPAIITAGIKYAYGIGMKKNCNIGTQFLKEAAFDNISDKLNNKNLKGNFAQQRFKIELYEYVESIYNQKNQITTFEQLLQIYNLYKDDTNQNSQKNQVISEIGLRYFYGIQVEQNYKKAKEWFELGIKYEIGQCYGYLGEIYLHGFGLEEKEIDYKKAMDYFNKAILHGESALGYSGLGYIYYYGLGIPKNKKEAYNCFVKGIKLASKESSFETTSLFYNMISLLIEDDSEDEEKNNEEEIINYDNLNDENNVVNNKNNENNLNKNKIDDKDKNNNKVPKDFNLAYKYANYLTFKQRSYGTYILAMMNEYNINAKLFSCEENFAFFKFCSYTNYYSVQRTNLAKKLYENKKYKGAFLITMEMAYEGEDDSLTNIIALLLNRKIFNQEDYQKYLTRYFIEFNLRLENYDLYLLSLSAKFFYQEKDYKRAIEMNKLLINHAGGNDKKFYIAEGFFNLGLMENFGKGLNKNLTKAYQFFKKAEKFEISSQYPLKAVNIINNINKIFKKENDSDIYHDNLKNNNKNVTKGNKFFMIIYEFIHNLNLLSISVTGFLCFYGWFFFSLKYQDSGEIVE